MKQAVVYWKSLKAGTLTESDEGYSFVYDEAYLALPEARAISLTLPSLVVGLSKWLPEAMRPNDV